MSNIYHQFDRDGKTMTSARSINSNNMTIDHVWVGSGSNNSHLLAVASVLKKHVYNDELSRWEMLFMYKISGQTVASLTFKSNSAGTIGKLLQQSAAYIGKLKTTKVK